MTQHFLELLDEPLEANFGHDVDSVIETANGDRAFAAKTIRKLHTRIDNLLKGLDLIADIEPDPKNMQRFHDIANGTIARDQEESDQ